MQSIEVAIVGGGPAGTTAARIAGEAGLDTVIFEKEKLPRSKPCGGGVTCKALELCQVEKGLFHQQVSKVAFAYRGDTYLVDYSRPVTFLTERADFDYHLWQKAEGMGIAAYSPC
ncbi:MAG: FAD-dependent monooxygenase, partial [Halanaerobium sp.]|nr:FAD-dependent monooxygenase [Halanaerobium sp.]